MSRPALTATPATSGGGVAAITNSTHRLATVSASSALQKASSASSSVSTGARHIDALLAGGLARGKVAEVYGPPGVGKTTLGICAAASVIRDGGTVVWIDCAHQLPLARLTEILNRLRSSSQEESRDEQGAELSTSSLRHFTAPTLAHLLALILHPQEGFPPAGTRLVVVDSISTPFSIAFPSSADSGPEARGSSGGTGSQQQQWGGSRRWSAQRDVVLALGRLAAVHDAAVLLTTQMATRLDRESLGFGRTRALLRPALAGKSWSDALWARLVLFRHWGPARLPLLTLDRRRREVCGDAPATRYAGLVKVGSLEYETFGRVVPFAIDDSGLRDLDYFTAPPPQQTPLQVRPLPGSTAALPSVVPSKRKTEEIADSESEDEGGLHDGLTESEVEELDELGLNKEEQALLELEVENTIMSTLAGAG